MKTTRIIPTIAAAALLAGAASEVIVPQARATKGQCDPGPGQFNLQTLGDSEIVVTVRYGWDGVSLFPDCDGPIQDVRLQNVGTRTRTLSIPAGRKLKSRDILPGTDVTFTGAQLAQIGLETAADLADMTLSP